MLHMSLPFLLWFDHISSAICCVSRLCYHCVEQEQIIVVQFSYRKKNYKNFWAVEELQSNPGLVLA